ncbi:MAG: hypothetical protein JWO56_2191 [Acidobacteria bacterium]|nr:hypothetical protein [Acidobacteriota bacterium]
MSNLASDVPFDRLSDHRSAPLPEVSTLRLYLLRATYLLLLVGLGLMMWPGVLHHDNTVSTMGSVVRAVLTAVSLLAALGLRYPLKMLPLLFFELIWKSIWLLSFALPLWSAGKIDAATAETIVACLWGVIFPIVIPWRYVWANYVKAPGDRWR